MARNDTARFGSNVGPGKDACVGGLARKTLSSTANFTAGIASPMGIAMGDASISPFPLTNNGLHDEHPHRR
ncbi:hypothetical protein CHELA20_52473 [Hyphomicrobiales bacterium]|nr:hypothetical protein CHELA41_22450 [Hyphomicrobiales bacterium]CAH1681978.1 hypothetical protein CHELA20_52473 [Hyphomicrobiales bacterium]